MKDPKFLIPLSERFLYLAAMIFLICMRADSNWIVLLALAVFWPPLTFFLGYKEGDA